MFTPGFTSIVGNTKITLFVTGHHYADENLNDILEKRSKGLSPPIQMCDGLSRNIPKDFETILSTCIAHGRRRFIEVKEPFPKECRYVLKTLEKVYANDAYSKEMNMSPEERLKYHQEKSGTLIDDLKTWLENQLEEKNIEPNSSLGEAISYMLKHYKQMTLFLRVAKAPLITNFVSRYLKERYCTGKTLYFTRHQMVLMWEIFL